MLCRLLARSSRLATVQTRTLSRTQLFRSANASRVTSRALFSTDSKDEGEHNEDALRAEMASFFDNDEELTMEDYEELVPQHGEDSMYQLTPEHIAAELVDIDNPPILTDHHYKLLAEVDPESELVAQRLLLQNIEYKMAGKLPELGTERFLPEDVEDFDQIAEWDKPVDHYKKTRKAECVFCNTAEDPKLQITYTNLELLHKFINMRGMVTGRRVSGNCGPHQRRVEKAIKRARHLSLMSELSDWKASDIASQYEHLRGEDDGGDAYDSHQQYLDEAEAEYAAEEEARLVAGEPREDADQAPVL